LGLASLALVAPLLLAACDEGEGTGADPDTTGDTSPTPTGTPGGAAPTATAGADATRGGGVAESTPAPSGSPLELRDGTWEVGEAGTVEFSASADTLELIDVNPASGWSETEREVERDEIEVQFERDNLDWTIEVQLSDGVLEIEIDQDIDDGEPGTYTVGEAGTVEFALQGGALALVEVLPNEGWTSEVDEASDDDIEVDFRRENVTYDFDVELDDGTIDIDLDFEIEGPWPR